ncbi:MAG: SH3 domain-containing protein [Chloroflexota bacterium]
MKRRLLFAFILLAVAAVLIAAQTAPTSTPSPTPTPTVSVVIGLDVFVRGGPGRQYVPVGKLILGDKVTPLSRNENADWVLITYNDGYGWVRRDLVTWAQNIDLLPIMFESNLTPSPGSPNRPDQTIIFLPTPTPSGNWVQLVDAPSGYVRAGPGRTFLRLGQLIVGTIVDPVGRNSDTTWIMIRFGDGFGWVRHDLVHWVDDLTTLPILDGNALTPTATFTATNTPTVTFTPTPTFTATATSTFTPTLTSTLTPTNTPSPTVTPTFTSTPTLTNTPIPPSATSTSTTTFTPVPPTSTPQPPVLTETPIVQALVPSNTPPATATPLPSATSTHTFTPVPPTSTPQSAVSTETPVVQALVPSDTPPATATPLPSNTPVSTLTATLISSTNTPSPTETLVSSTMTPGTPIATFNQGVNVRSGPGTEFNPPIGSFPAGQTAEILAHTPAGDWYKIRYFNQDGWVAAQFVTVSGDASLIPVESGLPTPVATAPTQQAPTATLTLPSPTPTVTVTSSAAIAQVPTAIPQSTPVPEAPTTAPGTLPVEAIVGGLALLLVLIYIGLYWRGLNAVERYNKGFVVRRCPACDRGDMVVETKVDRLLGIPRPRRTVRCTECRSVLREVGTRRWRYAVDPMENPSLYKHYNGHEIDDATLVEIGSQPVSSENVPAVPRSPLRPPSFTDDEDL